MRRKKQAVAAESTARSPFHRLGVGTAAAATSSKNRSKWRSTIKSAIPVLLAFWVGYHVHTLVSLGVDVYQTMGFLNVNNPLCGSISKEALDLLQNRIAAGIFVLSDHTEDDHDAANSRVPYLERLVQGTGYFHAIPIGTKTQTTSSVNRPALQRRIEEDLTTIAWSSNERDSDDLHLKAWQRIADEGHDRFVLILHETVELSSHISTASDFVSHFVQELERQSRFMNNGLVHLGAAMAADCIVDTDAQHGIRHWCSNSINSNSSSMQLSPPLPQAYMITPQWARLTLHSMNNGTRSAKEVMLQSMSTAAAVTPWLGWNYTSSFATMPSAASPILQRGLFHIALRIVVAHQPRNDLLGSFVTPTLLLYAVAQYHGWTLEILPYIGSDAERNLRQQIALGHDIDPSWGSGLQDASHRVGFDPVTNNAAVYDVLAFFPNVIPNQRLAFASYKNWTRLSGSGDVLPGPGPALDDLCRHQYEAAASSSTSTLGQRRLRPTCYILLPDDPYVIERHMKRYLGSFDAFFTKPFRDRARRIFMKHNAHRLRHFNASTTLTSTTLTLPSLNVAIHVRRGDIMQPDRWIEQSVFATLVQSAICAVHPYADVHVYSAGPNRDGNWSILESISTTSLPSSSLLGGRRHRNNYAKCRSVSFHLDELEFDTWTHMVAADVLVMSKSNFGLIPSLLSGGTVYYPSDYWHLRLSSFRLFDSRTGNVVG